MFTHGRTLFSLSCCTNANTSLEVSPNLECFPPVFCQFPFAIELKRIRIPNFGCTLSSALCLSTCWNSTRLSITIIISCPNKHPIKAMRIYISSLYPLQIMLSFLSPIPKHAINSALLPTSNATGHSF